MLKEIMEQPRVVADCLSGRVDGAVCCCPNWTACRYPDACVWWPAARRDNAGLWARHLLEGRGGVPTEMWK